MSRPSVRNLVLVLGDQLDRESAALDGFAADRDIVWMAENAGEATHVWSSQHRLVTFFACMRHYRDALREKDWRVAYHELSTRQSEDRGKDFAEILRNDVNKMRPEKLIVVEPGDFRVREMLRGTAKELGVELVERTDRHFFDTVENFRAFAEDRKSLVLETYYRQLRKREEILVDSAGKPVGGEWNFDQQNRDSFGAKGPPEHKSPRSFAPDAVTREVIEMVKERFGEHPGSVDSFALPVTRKDALAFLREFIEERLPRFGTYQDALWTGGDFLFHSRLSVALNLKLLCPREVVAKAVKAYEEGAAPLPAVEGFVRQILGWREFVRGIYWLKMPDYAKRNHLEAERDVPRYFWDGDTDMVCVREAMRNVIEHGYAHHIQRLMVLGLFAQLYGVHPYRFHEWHMAMYSDAVDWVSLPNALGMSQYGDGGIVGTKPYCASGNYINKMSNYCASCRYNYKKNHGEDACPFSVLYYDFLARHRKRFGSNRRMTFQMKNLEKKEASGELRDIRKQAEEIIGRERL